MKNNGHVHGAGFIESAIKLALALHVVLTIFENLPDEKVKFGIKTRWLGSLPQWRFFAPNPGIEDTHLMFRIKVAENWEPWQEFAITSRLHWHAFIWNPKSRSPKVLFDAVQQLRILSNMGQSFEVATRSAAYILLSDLIHDRCTGEFPAATFSQFMILNSRPGTQWSTMNPVLVSQEIKLT